MLGEIERAATVASPRTASVTFDELRNRYLGEAASDVDAFEGFVVLLVGAAEVFGHGVGIVEIGDCGGETAWTHCKA